MTEKQHLTVLQLAKRLQLTKGQVYFMNHRGTGPRYIKIGKNCRYRLVDVEKWEESHLSAAS